MTTQADPTWLEKYRAKVHAERLAEQAEPVKLVIEDIRTAIDSLQSNLFWALDPDEKERDYCLESVIERAHTLVDLAHDYRQALKANPAKDTP
jgi:hypothetical protein